MGGLGLTQGHGLGSPWRLLVTNSPSLSGRWYPWRCCRAFLSPGLLGLQPQVSVRGRALGLGGGGRDMGIMGKGPEALGPLL